MADGLSHNRKCALSTKTTQVSGAHTDFPVLFTEDNLPAEMFDADGSFPAQNGGGDIRFTSDAAGSNLIPCQVISFVTDNDPVNGKAEIWVRLPNVRDTQVDTIYAWYNTSTTDSQPAVTAAHGRNAVWSAAEYIYHLNETPGVGAGVFIDSKGTGADLEGVGLAAGDQVDGPFGKGVHFAGGDRAIQDTADTGLRDLPLTYDMTVAVLLRRPANATGHHALVSWNGPDDIVILDRDSVNAAPRVFWRDLGGSILNPGSPDTTNNTWHRLYFTTRASNDHELYLDGSSIATSTNTGSAGSFIEGGFWIGEFSSLDQPANADIAFVHLFAARSDDWVATYDNAVSDPDGFIAVGTPESVGGGDTVSANNGNHSHTADTGAIIPAVAAQTLSAVHAHPSDAASVIALAVVGAAEGAHPQQGETPATFGHVAAVATEANHGHHADAAAVGLAGQASPLEAAHLIISDAPVSMPFAVVGPFDAPHAHLAAGAFATTASLATPIGRRLVVPARRATLNVADDGRNLRPTA